MIYGPSVAVSDLYLQIESSRYLKSKRGYKQQCIAYHLEYCE